METRAHYVLIGAFVLCAMALAFLFVLWLGQTKQSYDDYDVIFRERVSGLQKGSAVRFNGIQKGEVIELRLDADNPNLVVARVRVDDDTPIRIDTKAELEPFGVTGLAIIQFTGGSPDAPLLKDEVRGIPEIEAQPSIFANLFEGTGKLMASATQLFSDENVANIEKILLNVEGATGALADQDESIEAIIKNTAKITGDIAAVSGRLTALTADLEQLLSEDAPGTMAETEAMLVDARRLINELQGIAADNREGLLVFTNEGLAQIGPAITDARRMINTMDGIMQDLDRDPRGFLLGEPAPEYEATQ